MRQTIIALVLAAAIPLFAADEPGWRIEVTTSGGFTGRGTGGITVSSDGALAIRSDCTLHLVESDLHDVRALVEKAKPQEWKPSYVKPTNPNGCCDMVKTTLTMTRGGARWTSTWFDDHLPMPPDLEAIVSALFDPGSKSLRSRYKPQCSKP